MSAALFSLATGALVALGLVLRRLTPRDGSAPRDGLAPAPQGGPAG